MMIKSVYNEGKRSREERRTNSYRRQAMIKKRYVILVVCLLIVPFAAHAMSYAEDTFIINNHTDGDIFIEVECWEEPQVRGSTWMINKKMGVLEIAIDVYITNKLGPKKQMDYLTFMPKWPRIEIDGRNPYDFLHAIPMLDIVRSVIKSLRITNERDDLLFSLEDAREEDFTAVANEWVNEIDYFLNIYDDE
jgi:hypothetical protein